MLALSKNRVNSYRHKVTEQVSLALSLVLAFSIVGCNQVDAAESNAAELFLSKCSGCHTIGGGDGVGPDLKHTKSWANDKLKTGVEKMSAMAGGLNDSEVMALVNYLKAPELVSAKTDSGEPVQELEAPEEIEKELPGSAEEGRDLFFGKKLLKNGGMSCISCHQSKSESALGPSLEGVSQKYKPRALVSACKQAPFKVMLAAYKNHPITEAEALSLAKYLSEEDKQEKSKKNTSRLSIVPVGGGIALAFLTVLAVGYRNRNRSIKDKLKRK